MKKIPIAIGLLAFMSAAMAEGAGTSPYAGQESRRIKALSGTEVQDYLDGKGMGMSKVAELNSHPGPTHVLQLSSQLGLTASQLDQLQRINRQMQIDAAALGKRLIQSEEALQNAVLKGKPLPEEVARLIDDSAAVQGKLRAVHVLAHLKTSDLLTPDQILAYNRLRGYTGQSTTTPAQTGADHHHHSTTE